MLDAAAKSSVKADILSNTGSPVKATVASSVTHTLPPHPSTLGAYNPVLSGSEGDAQLQHTLDNAVSDLAVNTKAAVLEDQVNVAVPDVSLLQPQSSTSFSQAHDSTAVIKPVLSHVEQLTADVTPNVKESIREKDSLEVQKDEEEGNKSWKIALYIAAGLGIFLLGMIVSVVVLTFL